jgi:2Fe-2S ferredoxin
MPKIIVKPHPELCPNGAEFESPAGKSLCDALLDNGVEIDHACGKAGACTTCHVLVREGFESLNELSEKEEDMLDRAWGLEPASRLSCQAIVDNEEIIVEIPKYSINLVSEDH